MKRVVLQAHRGVAAYYPENTMSAFRAAVAEGYGIIELDPSYTADGEIVVLHDAALNRTARHADGTPLAERTLIYDIPYAEAASYDYGLFMGEDFRGEHLPLFTEVLDFAAKTKIPLKVDNKIWSFPPEIREKLMGQIAASEADVQITCQSVAYARAVHERFPDSVIHYDGEVTEENLRALREILDREHLVVWLAFPNEKTNWVKVRRADSELCDIVKRYAALGLWILSETADYEAAKKLGADLVETTGTLKPET